MDMNESLLRAIFATVGRNTFAPQQVYRVVTPHGGSDKQLAAYNLCDGKAFTPAARAMRCLLGTNAGDVPKKTNLTAE
jgi:hypothetical protein